MKKYRMKKEISYDFKKFENQLKKPENEKVEDKTNSNKINEKSNT